MALKGLIIVLAFAAIWAILISAIIVCVAEDESVELTPEEIAEECSRYACYEDGDIES